MHHASSLQPGNRCSQNPATARGVRADRHAINAIVSRSTALPQSPLPPPSPLVSVFLVAVTHTMNASRSVAGSLASVLGFALVFAVSVVESDTVAPDIATPQTTETNVPAEGRGHFKKMMLNPYMLIPQLIALGFTPIVLANLKMMVMSALMINNMALNAAIFMTIRNLVFGPRPKVKYINHGYHEHHHNHRQEDGDHPHYHNQRQSEQQPPSLQHHTSTEGTQTGTDQRRKRTDTTIAASLRRPAPPPLLRHRV